MVLELELGDSGLDYKFNLASYHVPGHVLCSIPKDQVHEFLKKVGVSHEHRTFCAEQIVARCEQDGSYDVLRADDLDEIQSLLEETRAAIEASMRDDITTIDEEGDIEQRAAGRDQDAVEGEGKEEGKVGAAQASAEEDLASEASRALETYAHIPVAVGTSSSWKLIGTILCPQPKMTTLAQLRTRIYHSYLYDRLADDFYFLLQSGISVEPQNERCRCKADRFQSDPMGHDPVTQMECSLSSLLCSIVLTAHCLVYGNFDSLQGRRALSRSCAL